MQVVINELMQILEINNPGYFGIAIGIIFGALILWRLCK